jgi:hypothetical protein
MKRKLGAIGAVIIGLATLALPVRVAARDFRRDGARGGFHDHGRHLGWFKHHHDADDYRYAAHDCDRDEEDSYPHYGQPPTTYYPRYSQPPAVYYPRYTPAHREPDQDDQFRCDEDGDDCEPVRQFQSPEPYLPPVAAPRLQFGPGLVATPYLLQQRNQFASLRHDALGYYGRDLRQGNRGGANYWIRKVKDYDYRIAALNRLIARQSGQGSNYGRGYSYIAAPTDYYGGSATPYGYSPDAVTSTLLPMLGQFLTR